LYLSFFIDIVSSIGKSVQCDQLIALDADSSIMLQCDHPISLEIASLKEGI
jgi:hypothetical protein